jgi:hypothetical protein
MSLGPATRRQGAHPVNERRLLQALRVLVLLLSVAALVATFLVFRWFGHLSPFTMGTVLLGVARLALPRETRGMYIAWLAMLIGLWLFISIPTLVLLFVPGESIRTLPFDSLVGLGVFSVLGIMSTAIVLLEKRLPGSLRGQKKE